MPKPKTRQKRPTVSIIGPGRVGRSLAYALQSAGWPVVALVFRNAKQLQSETHLRSVFPKTLLLDINHLEQLPSSDLLLITTPDDAIEQTAQKITAAQKPPFPKSSLAPFKLIPPGPCSRAALHTSGALSSEVLHSLTTVGFVTGSMHPLVSVSDGDRGKTLRGARYGLEGAKEAVLFAQAIVRDLGGEVFGIDPRHKDLYHAAAVMASPHLVALFDLVVELLVHSGLKQGVARKILLPLLDSTINNLHTRDEYGDVRDPSEALTGTFARGDVGTVERHLKALSKETPKLPAEALEIYKLLGLRSLQLAKRRGLSPKKISQIKKLLKDQSPKR